MRALTIFALIAGVICNFASTVLAEEYYTGALRGNERPSWMSPSPTIELNNPLLSLDEACDNSGGLPPVGNQSSQGSCTAWAAGYYYLTYLQGQDSNLDLTDPENQMSPAFIYNLINGGIDGGSYPGDAFRVFEELGCGKMSDMPYNVSNFTDFPSEQAFRGGMQYRTLNTYYIDLHSSQGMIDIKNHLLNGGIAATAITVWDNFQGITGHDYIYSVADIAGTDPGGHAVTIIGFDDDLATPDGPGAFRMVNSWGTGWGDDGFWWMTYEAAQNSQIGWGTAYYSSDRLDYQPTMIARIELDHTDRYSLEYRMSYVNVYEQEQFFSFTRSRDTIPFSSNVFTIDLTDISENIDPDVVNNFNFQVIDNDDYNNHSGNLVSATVEDLTNGHIGSSDDFPVTITDRSSAASGVIKLYYPAVAPETVTSEINFSTGDVTISWSEVTDAIGFVGYELFRDGESIATTTELSFQDNLTEYGTYAYTVRSNWTECNSVHSIVESVTWVTPLESRNLNVDEISADGACKLSWDQTRNAQIIYDDGTAEADIFFNANVTVNSKVAQRFSASSNGKLNELGIYIAESGNTENGLIRLAVFSNGANNEPSSIVWESESFIPDNTNYWYWLELGVERVWFDEGDEFWIAVIWEDMGDTPIGRDHSGQGNETHMLQIGDQNWFSIGGGHPMIRAGFSNDELIDDGSGLLGFNVYKNDSLIELVESDDHISYTTLSEAGDYTFRVDAIYQQEIITGQNLEYTWDGSVVDVEDEILPLAWKVEAAYPNPFNPSTMLTVQMADAAELNVDIFNVLGQKVATLATGRYEQGIHKFNFNANGLTSGIYFIRTVVPGKVSSIQKVTFMR
jgi:C1A family cysteine protease